MASELKVLGSNWLAPIIFGGVISIEMLLNTKRPHHRRTGARRDEGFM
jgi:hypothetical protein